MQRVDKAIICNKKALIDKYKGAIAPIEIAIQNLINSDLQTRNLVTQVIWVDDESIVREFGVQPPINSMHAQGYKEIIDAIHATVHPDYILLLDGPDVVPHIVLDNLVLEDNDQDVPSDLPYACDSRFSVSTSQNLAVTRVVGRLPAAIGESDPGFIVGLLDHVCSHSPRRRVDHSEYFAISAEPWQQSTQTSLHAVFGSHAGLNCAPPARCETIRGELGRLTHFINCHGATNDPRFYGGQSGEWIAMHSKEVDPHILAGTVVAAECCYGAEIYDPSVASTDLPMCLTYLRKGAIAFLGSSTMSYGPAVYNGQADLITQFFLQNILDGASTGRALLQARQKFIRTQRMASPPNLKTIAQFHLLGDPSLQACRAPLSDEIIAHGLAASADPLLIEDSLAPQTDLDATSQRKARRIYLAREGPAVKAVSSYPGKKVRAEPEAEERFLSLAHRKGFATHNFAVYQVQRPQGRGVVAKAKDLNCQVAVMAEKREKKEGGASIHVFVAHIINNGIVAFEECESR